MVMPPVQGEDARALACGLSHVQADIHGITSFYHLRQCRPCSLEDISCQIWKGSMEGSRGGRGRQAVWTFLEEHVVIYNHEFYKKGLNN